MKTLQKLILPVLIIAAVFLVYKFYFVKGDNLGSFSDFDPNNNAVKEIRVQLLAERGINKSFDGGAVFFASDKNNKILQINADKVPGGLDTVNILILWGHLTKDSFHAHDVVIE